MELVTIFRGFGKDSGVEKVNSLCPHGGDAGFRPRDAAGAVAGAVGKDSGVEKVNSLCPRGGDACFCPRNAAGAVAGVASDEGDGCVIDLDLRCSSKDGAGFCPRVASCAGAGSSGFLGGELLLLFPVTGKEKGSSSVTTLEDFSMAALGCKWDGFTSFRFKSADIVPLIDGTECGEVGIVVAG